MLASRSPQRRALMAALGLPFRVVASRYAEESDHSLDPESAALAHARGKVGEVARRSGIPAGGCVLGVDTVVAVDGLALGKPRDPAEADDMLARLSGRAHRVVSAVALRDAAGEQAVADVTEVRFRPLTAEARAWYLGTGEWRERAGGYAIQGAGAALVEGITGDYTTVVGLPVARLVGLLADRGLAPWARPAPD